MTNEQIRIAVAELCGWRLERDSVHWAVFDTNGDQRFISWMDYNEGRHAALLPNYPESLDACREFEQPMFDRGDSINYYLMIGTVILATAKGFITDRSIFFSTPLQRCKAFLSIHGKWIKTPTTQPESKTT